MENELHKIIFEILDDNTGGLKYMKLLIEILKIHFMDKPIEELKGIEEHHIAEYLLDELEKMEGIKVIEYTYLPLKGLPTSVLLRSGRNRTKYFVCT